MGKIQREVNRDLRKMSVDDCCLSSRHVHTLHVLFSRSDVRIARDGPQHENVYRV